MNSLSSLILPTGYRWLLDRNLVGYGAFTQLQPWNYLPPEQCFWASDRWPGVTDKRLFAFAKRQDRDDLACFVVACNNATQGIALINGWTESGYDLCQEFDDFWDWLKYVVDDMAGWANAED